MRTPGFLALLLCWTTLSHAALLCPMTFSPDEDLRQPTLAAPQFRDAIHAELGLAPGIPALRYLTEVRGATPTSENRMLIRLEDAHGAAVPFSALSDSLQGLILASPPAGAGCTDLPTPESILAVSLPAREPRRVGALLDYDADDTTRAIINPTAFGLREAPPTINLLLTDAPSTSVLEDCNGSEDPLATGWTSEYETSDAGGLGEGSGHCGRITCAGVCSSYYDLNTAFTNDQEAYADLQDATGSEAGLLEIIFGCTTATLGGATPTCYKVRMTERTATDEWSILRYDGTTNSSICSSPTVLESADGDGMMGRRTGTLIALHRRSASVWSVLNSCTDSTYTGAGGIAFASNANNMFFDNLGGGSVVSATPARRRASPQQ